MQGRTDSRVRALRAVGQSLWLDTIRRDLVEGGELAQMIEQHGLAGMTTNPSIFAAAIAAGGLYDDAVSAARQAGFVEAEDVATAICIDDVRRAADVFRPVYEETEGLDGYVSIEVSPHLAWDAAATIEAARSLWARVERPNAMIKIPGTAPGLEAVETCLAEGINVNVTLLFSVERYREVARTYQRALRRRIELGQPVDRIASVASFFVSRIDTRVDALLAERAAQAPPAEAEAMRAMQGRVAVYNARLAYAAFEELFGPGSSFDALRARGARVQRPLWASTSTKNPAYPDTLYVDELVAPDTVNTVPLSTWHAFVDHGSTEVRIHDDLDAARAMPAQLAEWGIDLGAVTAELEREGVDKFVAAWDALVETVRNHPRLG